MGIFVRNSALVWQFAVLVFFHGLVWAFAFFGMGLGAGNIALVSGGVSCVLFCVYALFRHRETMRLVSEIDEVLHGGRRLEFRIVEKAIWLCCAVRYRR